MRYRLALCLLVMTAAPALAERAAVQVSDERSFGRIVIALDPGAKASVRQRRTKVDVMLPANTEIASPDTVPRNVVSFVGGRGDAHITLVPGSLISSKREGNTFVIDVLDPGQRDNRTPSTAASRPNPAKPPAQLDAQKTGEPTAKPAPPPESRAEAPPPPRPAEPKPEPAPAPPAAPAAAAEPPPPPPAPVTPPRPIVRSATVTAGADIGAAAFRRGSIGVVIFDDAVTLADGDDEPTVTPTLQPIQRGTLMTFPLASDETLALTRSADGITVTIAPATGSPAVETAIPTGIQYQVSKPGRAMAVSDPISGQTMLVGTTRQVNGDHAMVDTARSAPGYVMLPTWLGVALEISSDRIDLKALLSGYTIEIADKAATNAAAAARQENQFSIPVAPAAVLVQQLNAQIASAAAAPPRGRGPDRVAAARTMLALGMSAESSALLGLAATDDPAVARDPNTAALAGVAAILAGRPADATGLDNPALPTGGDIALWRGLRDVAQGRPAPALAGAWPLLSAYPPSMRRQIAPAVLEAAAENGAEVPAREMEGPSLALARALKLAHDGQTDQALTEMDAVKNSRDERDSVRAAVAATELRLRSGKLTAADAAEQLDRQTVRWRGDVRELALRLRVAALRTQAGQWRATLDGLRQTEAVFPDAKAKVAELKTDVFRALLSQPDTAIAPLELVSVAGDFADGLPDGADGDRLAGLLADKLAALDLPARAIPVLKTLIDKSQSPAAQTEFALRLAPLQLDAGNPVAAETLLQSLDMSGVAPEREEQRTMLLARAKAARGDYAGGATVLLMLSSPEANEMRANYYARAGDWQRSLDTLEAIAASSVPETGDLNEKQQDLLLREATAAVQAGNGDALKRLGKFERRLTPPRADLFRVLTATAVKSPEDLPRAARELAMSKALPERLNALKTR